MSAAFKVVQIPIVTQEELAGLTFIQRLQKTRGVETSFKEALAGWRKMTPGEREATKRTYLFIERSRN